MSDTPRHFVLTGAVEPVAHSKDQLAAILRELVEGNLHWLIVQPAPSSRLWEAGHAYGMMYAAVCHELGCPGIAETALVPEVPGDGLSVVVCWLPKSHAKPAAVLARLHGLDPFASARVEEEMARGVRIIISAPGHGRDSIRRIATAFRAYCKGEL